MSFWCFYYFVHKASLKRFADTNEAGMFNVQHTLLIHVCFDVGILNCFFFYLDHTSNLKIFFFAHKFLRNFHHKHPDSVIYF